MARLSRLKIPLLLHPSSFGSASFLGLPHRGLFPRIRPARARKQFHSRMIAMYCSECGTKAMGKFCVNCGAKIVRPAEPDRLGGLGLADIPEENLEPAEVVDESTDWTTLADFDALMRVPEVRDRLARAGNQAKKRLSGEQFLELCDKAFKPLGGISLASVASLAQPIYAQLGIRTGKVRSEFLSRPIGAVIVDVLCSFARAGQNLIDVQRSPEGVVLRAKLPSDIWSLEGELIVAIRRVNSGTALEAATNIPGQWFDWGKSRRNLDELFERLRTAA